LAPLRQFAGLRRLYLDGATRDLGVLSELVGLDSLTLRSVTLPDLASLRPLTSLRALELKLGGTTNLSGIGEVGDIRYLELSRVFGFRDLTPLQELSNLEYVCLQSLPRIRHLPDLSRLPNLRELYLEDMPGLSEDELRTLPPGIEVGSGWSRPILTPELTPSGVRVHGRGL
jgi:internalin A